jgi:hypothetical protein
VAELSKHYKEKYGAWAGFPKGHPPKFDRCCEEVREQGRWPKYFQCSRPNGYGPDGAYCKQHDPEAVAKRRAAADARSKAAWRKRMLEAYGSTFYDALVKIAEGHNDARGLAQETLAKFKY